MDIDRVPDLKRRDPLTGLLSHDMVGTARDGSAIAFVYLLQFRSVNERYGHLVGDRALRTVAGRLRDGLAPFRVFRYGGDEFLVEIDQPLDHEGATMLARRIGALVGQPIDGIAEPLEARVGVTLRRVVRDMTSSTGAKDSHAVTPVLIEAERAADEARVKSLPFVVVPEPGRLFLTARVRSVSEQVPTATPLRRIGWRSWVDAKRNLYCGSEFDETDGDIAEVRDGSALAVVDVQDLPGPETAPYGHRVEAAQSVAERLRESLAPFRVFRFRPAKFLVEIDQPLDQDSAAILAGRIGELVRQPLDGIAEPLDVRVGISLRQVVHAATERTEITDLMDVYKVLHEAEQAAVEARLADLPFIVICDQT